MRIVRWPAGLSGAMRGAVVAIGNFDGVHLGHRAVIRAAADLARAASAPLGVVTFEPHPREVLQPDRAPPRLTPFALKAALLRREGVEQLYALRFDDSLRRRSAEQFVDEVLIGDLGVRGIVAGRDFRFGNQRSGDVATLTRHATSITVEAIAAVAVDEEACSSTLIRRLLTDGEVAAAARLLGYPYEVDGPVRHGDQRGRTIGFPTANVHPRGRRRLLPGIGVYAVRAGLREGSETVWYPAVANLGRRPTVDGRSLLLEVHLLEGGRDLYGCRMRVAFVERLRDEHKFDGLDALKAQLMRDREAARIIHGFQAA